MRDINLLPHSGIKGNIREQLGRFSIVLILMFSIIILNLCVYGYMHFMVWKYKDKEVLIDKDIKIYSIVNGIKNDIKIRKEKIERMSGVIDMASHQASVSTKVLDKITGMMPEGLFLINCSIGSSGQMTLNGKSKDRENIAHFLYKIKQANIFNQVDIKSINGNAGGKEQNEGYSFTITVNLKN